MITQYESCTKIPGLECIRSGTKLDKDECLKVEGLEVPEQSQPCAVDCQGSGCVIGQWSAWSDCSSGCPSARTRTRQISPPCSPTQRPQGTDRGPMISSVILEPKNPVEGVTETENCPCNQYRSVPNGGQWSQCILEAQSESSKIGKRFRRLDCLDSNNQIVDIK